MDAPPPLRPASTRTKPLGHQSTIERQPAIPLDFEAWKAEEARRVRQEKLEEAQRDADAVRLRCQSFSEFVKEAWPIIEPTTTLRWNWHLDAMCMHLEAISRGRLSPRLIINVPPGSSKSTIVTVLWQAYEWGPLGKRGHRFVSTSFDLTNVKRDTAKTLDVVTSEWFQELWPEVVMKTKGVLSFSNTATGSRLGVAFKSVTGKRGDRLVIDDPHSLVGAESETERDGAVRNFIEGGLNRINDWETSAIVIVMQRLHTDDLTGALLAKPFGFIHLMIPMEFEPARRCKTPLKVDDGKGGKIDWTDPRSYEGELMDPVRVPEAANAINKLTGDYAYNGQYQQRPAPREGGMFKVEKIDIVESCPAGGNTVAGWDFAGSKRKKSPYSARVLMTRIGGDIYVRHVVRKQTTPTELNRMLKDTSVEDRNRVPNVLISIPQDPAQAGKYQKWAFSDLLIGFNFKATPETGDKETRAEPFAALVGAERVHLVRGDWNSDFIEELRNFPAGSLKDQVDAASRAFGELVGGIAVPENAGPELMEEEGAASRVPVLTNDDPWGA
jgi:predicted phage terminase large subunit-like protein